MPSDNLAATGLPAGHACGSSELRVAVKCTSTSLQSTNSMVSVFSHSVNVRRPLLPDSSQAANFACRGESIRRSSDTKLLNVTNAAIALLSHDI